ncbi:MAG TPA: nickel-dependent hydrogenase large subunit [Rhodocyclaceae bacterium]|nr:nickel-dependent hydrogenase large subunit [Rhodocyclaceae bacterium]HMZ84895.1 nickel-dependent hydrogenase large subunit [Rhodocyclaceae bacterium]HNA03376.1 nickel-dependent hydrogenase large subunit [Rhodocyclaceae bacterium]HNB77704.1 nickel-dependent hydrogenase large subunit [Rhodocyclaceae bacterium]HNC60487.1 nickel-dependent hydrogenase large subunit [Rhodocyclaceae bacterium]
MSVAGELSIGVRVADGEVRAVELASTRPQASRVLAGRTPADVARLVPMLFSLCGHAQQIAASVAIEAAIGEHTPDSERDKRTRRVRLEAIQEHLWRLMLDWPALLSLPPLRDAFARWYRRCAAAREEAEAGCCRQLASELVDYCDRTLLPLPLAQWLELDDDAALLEPAAAREWGPMLQALSAFDAVAPAGRIRAPVLLPDLSAAALSGATQVMDLEAFCHTPTYDDHACETGALAHGHALPLVSRLLGQGRNLAARVVARIGALVDCVLDLAGNRAVTQPVIDSHGVGPGIGLARIRTARGLLMHRVEMQGDRIGRYAIVAPTEWNFHPAGAMVREFVGARFDSDAQLLQRLRAMVLALDPCVAYRIDVSHA